MAREVIVLVGTKRGLFLIRSDGERTRWAISDPVLAGREIYYAFLDPRDGRTVWAASKHAVWGTHIHRSEDGGASWQVLEAAPHHADGRGLEAVWHLAAGAGSSVTVFAGIEPAGLFRSDDGGASWAPVSALNEHRTNASWQPAGGGLALHSIIVDPREPRRMYAAISAGGVYRSEDGGGSWTPINRGVRADFLPQQTPETGQCVHKLILHPARPDRLYQQNHCGVYRSDDRGDHWVDSSSGLPSEFGYALAVDPADADVAYVIPEESSHMRAAVGGRLRVYRTRDAGASWEPLTAGLPQAHAYVSVLRDAMGTDGREPCGVYFGTSTGHLFASRNGGDSWDLVAGFLPQILCATVGTLDPASDLRVGRA